MSVPSKNDIDENTKLYQLLQYLVNVLMQETEGREQAIADYIQNLSANQVQNLVKTILFWEKPEKLEAPDPDIVSAALMSA